MIRMIIVKLKCGEPHGQRSVINIFQKTNISTIDLTRDKGLIWSPPFMKVLLQERWKLMA